MRTREKGEMEVNPCNRLLLTRGSGRQGKGTSGELWNTGPTSVAAQGLGFWVMVTSPRAPLSPHPLAGCSHPAMAQTGPR